MVTSNLINLNIKSNISFKKNSCDGITLMELELFDLASSKVFKGEFLTFINFTATFVSVKEIYRC